MSKLDRWQSLILLLSIISGLILGESVLIQKHAGDFITPLLILMLYGLFLSVSLKEIGKAFQNKTFTLISVGLNFVWTPLLAWGLGSLFLADHPSLWLGFFILLVTPCTDWYLVFTGISKGNLPLSSALLPINLILQLVLLPVYVYLFSGSGQTFEVTGLLDSFLLIILLPFLLAQLTNYLLKKTAKQKFYREKVLRLFIEGQIIFLSLAITAIFASRGSYLFSHGTLVFILIIPLFFFYVINFAVGRFASLAAKFSVADTTSLHFTTMARNSPLALSIAYTAFPGQPLLILALVTGSLIELPVLMAVSRILAAINRRK